MRRLIHTIAVAASLLSLAARLFAAETPPATFDAANKLYEQGHFAEAADSYEALARNGAVASALQFNLGNAYYKSGHLGRAIAAYRDATGLAPRDPELRANLQFVRNQIQGPTLPPGRLQRWLNTLTLNEWTALASVALWAWLILLILPQWRSQWKPALRGYALAGGLATALLALCLGAAFHDTYSVRAAVVIAPTVAVHNGPLDESPSAFTLHDGAEVEILDAKEDWQQISAGPNRNGWVRREQVVVLNPKT